MPASNSKNRTKASRITPRKSSKRTVPKPLTGTRKIQAEVSQGLDAILTSARETPAVIKEVLAVEEAKIIAKRAEAEAIERRTIVFANETFKKTGDVLNEIARTNEEFLAKSRDREEKDREAADKAAAESARLISEMSKGHAAHLAKVEESNALAAAKIKTDVEAVGTEIKDVLNKGFEAANKNLDAGFEKVGKASTWKPSKTGMVVTAIILVIAVLGLIYGTMMIIDGYKLSKNQTEEISDHVATLSAQTEELTTHVATLSTSITTLKTTPSQIEGMKKDISRQSKQAKADRRRNDAATAETQRNIEKIGSKLDKLQTEVAGPLKETKAELSVVQNELSATKAARSKAEADLIEARRKADEAAAEAAARTITPTRTEPARPIPPPGKLIGSKQKVTQHRIDPGQMSDLIPRQCAVTMEEIVVKKFGVSIIFFPSKYKNGSSPSPIVPNVSYVIRDHIPVDAGYVQILNNSEDTIILKEIN